MTAMNPDASRQAVMEAALVLLERMGLTRRTWPPSRRTARRPSTSRSCLRRSARGHGGRRAPHWNRVVGQCVPRTTCRCR